MKSLKNRHPLPAMAEDARPARTDGAKTRKKRAWKGVLLALAAALAADLATLCAESLVGFLPGRAAGIAVSFCMMKLVHRNDTVRKDRAAIAHPGRKALLYVVLCCAPAQLVARAAKRGMWFSAIAGHGLPFGLSLVFTLVLAPITEEFAFRGAVFPLARKHMSFWPAVAVTAILFNFGHSDPVIHLLTTVPLTITAAAAYEATGDIRYPIAMHFLSNLYSYVPIQFDMPVPVAVAVYSVTTAASLCMGIFRDRLVPGTVDSPET